METILCVDGNITIPEKHTLSKDKKRLTIRSAWRSQVITLDKDCFQESTQIWFRSKKKGDKPYIPEGFIEIDGERYKFEDGVKV